VKFAANWKANPMGHRAFVAVISLLLLLFGPTISNANSQEPGHASQSADAQTPSSHAAPDSAYTLGPGDKIRVNVFGQQDLNGDYAVDGAGFVQLPLVGEVKAAGLTVNDFQKEVTIAFSNGFLVNPNIEVYVIDYRPYYIMGEVNKPGPYAYVSGMNIITAVALAGGYTTRADKSDVYVRRNGSGKEVELPADETIKVNPGDIIRVTERFF
jgi:polysaccharide export outer membrane protein